MNIEKSEQQITSLDEDGAAGTTAPDPTVHTEEIQDKVSGA